MLGIPPHTETEMTSLLSYVGMGSAARRGWAAIGQGGVVFDVSWGIEARGIEAKGTGAREAEARGDWTHLIEAPVDWGHGGLSPDYWG